MTFERDDAGRVHGDEGDRAERLEKQCSKCGRTRPIAEFYLRRRTGRRVAACRACMRAAARRWHRERAARDPEGYRRYRRRLYQREDGEKRRARWRRFYRRRGERAAARNRFRYLRACGVLRLGERCADCGAAAEDLHHWVEEGVLRLVSLCHRCHMRRHFATWRRDGGGPLRHHWEFEEEEE